MASRCRADEAENAEKRSAADATGEPTPILPRTALSKLSGQHFARTEVARPSLFYTTTHNLDRQALNRLVYRTIILP
jgi:hypothetical protein